MTTATPITCTASHSKSNYLDNPHIITVNDRRYLVCTHPVTHGQLVDPCGALVDVTDLDIVRVNTCCGAH